MVFSENSAKFLGGKKELEFLHPKSATKMRFCTIWLEIGRNKFLGQMGSVWIILAGKLGGKNIFLPFCPLENKFDL